MASYMRERGADAMLVLRNENKWAMTGKYFDTFLQNFVLIYFFCLNSFFLSVIFFCFVAFSVLVADVEVKEDCIFIRLRKEVVCDHEGSDKGVPSSVPVPVVEEVPVVGSEVVDSLEAIPEDLVFESGEACSLEGVDNIPVEELYGGSQCDGSVTSSGVAS
jgi:hypothetical protein